MSNPTDGHSDKEFGLELDDKQALWFDAQSIRDHFDGTESAAADWVASATDEQLDAVGEEALGSDWLYSAFHETLIDAVGVVRKMNP
jgi:hypothetical protein